MEKRYRSHEEEGGVKMSKDSVLVEVLLSTVGKCLAIDDIVVAGESPLGGGRVVEHFIVDKARLLSALSFEHGVEEQ